VTVSELIDYLQQFDGTETVVLQDDDYKGTGDFITLGDLDYSHEEVDMDTEPTEPNEDDIKTDDHQKFYQYGKLVFTVSEEKDNGKHDLHIERRHNQLPTTVKNLASVEAAIKHYMDQAKFWPDAWWISDHGNAHRIDLSAEYAKEKPKK
jgi:hypothetical protein